MKKLLLIGAMLIVGATSFSAVTEELTLTGADGAKTYLGTGRLPIESEGSILDSTGRVVLVVNPTDNAGTDGESLMFNFGAVGRGRAETLIGRFEAMVLKDNTKVDISKANITVKLEKNGATPQDAHKVVVEKSGTADKKLVDLTYELSSVNGLDSSGKVYNGEVIASAFRPLKNIGEDGQDTSGYVDGEFIDNSISLVFDIAGLEIVP